CKVAVGLWGWGLEAVGIAKEKVTHGGKVLFSRLSNAPTNDSEMVFVLKTDAGRAEVVAPYRVYKNVEDTIGRKLQAAKDEGSWLRVDKSYGKHLVGIKDPSD
ncbi:MAG: hypothetical protein V3S01_11215, partial [Dehalococcoidia bacterium]